MRKSILSATTFLSLFQWGLISPVAADSISDGQNWYYYPTDCSIALEKLSTNERYFEKHTAKTDVNDFRRKCRFFLAGSKVNSVKNKALGAAGSATKSVRDVLSDSAIGSFWDGLTK